MNDKQRTATAAIMHGIRTAERAKDASLRANSEFLTTIIDAAEQVGAEVGHSQPVIDDIIQALAASADGRRKLVRAHALLARFAIERGFDFRAVGDEGQTNYDEALRTYGASAAREIA